MPSWNELLVAARTATVPAPALRAVTLAQWILESGRGTSRLAAEHGNFAGLKWRPEMQGFATPVRYEAHDGVDTYCAFVTAEAFVAGYWRFIERAPYQGWRQFEHDPPGYVGFLKSRGYAGDPNYVAKVLALLPEAEGLLAETGGGFVVPEPDRPSRASRGETPTDRLPGTRLPNFVTLGEIRHVFRGPRPNGLEGAIVHYDAGRSRPRRGADDPEFGARNTLLSAQTHPLAFAYATVSRSGTIYLPGNMDWQQWGRHAGESRCPDTGRTDVSRFYVGFEVNAPGKLYPTTKADTFAPWFNCVRDSAGNVVLNAKGQATIVDAADETYGAAELRLAAKPDGNIAPGSYTRFTDAQFQALVAVMLWLRSSFPASFRLDRVFGHDEVSPGRKVDPGASLGGTRAGAAMTMAAFRKLLLQEWAELQG